MAFLEICEEIAYLPKSENYGEDFEKSKCKK